MVFIEIHFFSLKNTGNSPVGGERRAFTRRYETNLEAYDLYLQGRYAMTSFPAKGRFIANRAIQYFEQAIAKDANYAIAYAGIADVLLSVDRNMGAAAPPTTFARAKAAAERAVELDPMLSEGQSALASIRAREYAWQDAERGFRRAIELNSNNALAHLELGAAVLVHHDRFEEGLDEVGRAAALDSLSPYVNTEFGRALLLAGRFSEAVDQLSKAIALDPDRTAPYTLTGRALYLQGKVAEALLAFHDGIERGVPPGGTSLARVCRNACRTSRQGSGNSRSTTRRRHTSPWCRPDLRMSRRCRPRARLSRDRG